MGLRIKKKEEIDETGNIFLRTVKLFNIQHVRK